MDTGGGLYLCLLLVVSICACVVSGIPIYTSVVSCTGTDSTIAIGEVDEGYTGDVEVVTGIPPGSIVKLVPFLFADHLDFLEFIYTPGDTSATVQTRVPLNSDVIINTDRVLYYAFQCDESVFRDQRTLKVNNVNQSPKFTQELYNNTISEAHSVDTEVFQVTAEDGDNSPPTSGLTYSFEPHSDDFEVTNSGVFILKRRLNYNVVQTYNFTVTAMDSDGLNDTATVLINIEDFDNFDPFFSHIIYQALISENQLGSLQNVEPGPIKAQDGDSGINMTLIYSISAVDPLKYRVNFEIDSSTGVVSVVSAFDREELSSSVGSNVVSVSIQAAQTDDSFKTAHAVVYVTVEDVNDNDPQLDKSEYFVTLRENSPEDAVVLKVIATDLDQGGFDGTLRILPESAPFSIDSDGTVRVKNSAALDRETTETITFEIEAEDKNPLNKIAKAQVIVTLLDENDNNPIFTSDEYEGKVFKNQTVGMFLVQVNAEDKDADINGEIMYSIDFGNNNGYFSIEENSGKITLNKIIPLEENMILEFSLQITARDGGITSRSSTTQVNIYAPGDSKPQFLQNVYHGAIEEEQHPGVVILSVNFLAIPAEIPVTLQVETEADKFAISSTGEFSTKVKLDYDEAPHNYSVEISISDGVNNDTAVVEVQVIDINDNSPVFTPSSVTAPVPEDAVVGSSVTAVTATDTDSGFNKEIRYWLTGGEGRFVIDPVSGIVRVDSALDRETKAEYNLLVVAEDQGRPARSATATLTVQVADINDNVPEFSVAEYQVEVLETESVGTSLLTLSAVDLDEGANGRVTYSIFQQNPTSDPAVFELNPNGTLWLVQPLDYSEVALYSLMVQASDGGTPSLVGNGSVMVRVKDVNNNPPEFSQESYDVAVSENLANGTSVLTLKVTDRDEGGFVGTLHVLPESAPFSISSDGTITVTNSTALDRETTERIVFQVEARETNPPYHNATVLVSLTLLDENDNDPKFTSNEYATTVTNQTEGMSLVQVEAEDQDAGPNGQIQYSIDFGNQDDYFSIDANTGEITLKNIIPILGPQTLKFLLFITARDGGVVSRSTSAQVEILAVGDLKPHFTQKTFSGTIEEEKDPGTVILTVDFWATGETPVTLQVETEADKFAISSTGEFSTKVKLDYDEAPHNYSVEISISDGVNNDTAVVEVQVTDINDNSPVFTPSSVTVPVPEDAVVGSSVTAVTATDTDSGFNKEIRYWLTGGEERFVIDPVSGIVRVDSALDRETKAEYNLLVVAEDQGRPARSATATLTVQVADINDNVPEFSEAVYQVEVLETEPVGTSLLTLSAVDLDEGANGRVTYSIFQQNPTSDPAVFELNPNGTLWLVQPLDYSEVALYSLMVQATDGGTPSLVGNGSVVVRVKDVNNNPPEFSQESYDVAVSENLASGASILTLEVTDKDEGGFSSGFFLCTSDTFEINKQGVVSLRRNVTLDRETTDSYILQVVAVDQDTDGLSSTAQLNITVLDYNDNTPQFPPIPDPVEIPEGNYSEESPREVLTIVPTDADLGPNGKVTLSLSSSHSLFRFNEDGMLLAVGSLDRESRDSYDLVVMATDGGSPQRENVTFMRVSVTDVNDNTPEFSQSSYVSSILLKDAEAGKLLLTLSATDRDTGSNGLITYSFSAGGSPYLALNNETGAVTLTSNLADITEDTVLQLTAVATDHGLPPLSSTALVVVNLRVVSLVEVVAFSSSTYNFSLLENQQEVETVGTVLASSGSDLYGVTYTLKTYTDLFSINASGAIQTRAALNREEQEWYILNVEAVDTRTPPTSAVAVVIVHVEDVNESPQFLQEIYEASVFSIAPYKTSITPVKASDPDVGEEGQLVYSLSADSLYFDVEPSSGLVYVVSVVELAGQTVDVKVTATDPGGLHATTTVQVDVLESASVSDVVVISLNQPANVVEKKKTELETSLGAVLDWTVSIIEVSSTNGGASEARLLRSATTTLVSFIALDEERKVVPYAVVIEKLQSKSQEVKLKLAEVFGEGLSFDIETESVPSSDHDVVIIVLGVLLALSILALIVTVVVVTIRLKKKKKHDEYSDNESFDISQKVGYTNGAYEHSEQGKTETQDSNEEEKQQERNSERMEEDKQTSDDEKEQSDSSSDSDSDGNDADKHQTSTF